MANNLINDRPEFPAQPIQQHAEKIVNVEHANTIQTSNTIYIATGLPGGPGFQTTPFCFSRDYYNLVIFGNTPFTHEDHITLTTSDAVLIKDGNSVHIGIEYESDFQRVSGDDFLGTEVYEEDDAPVYVGSKIHEPSVATEAKYPDDDPLLGEFMAYLAFRNLIVLEDNPQLAFAGGHLISFDYAESFFMEEGPFNGLLNGRGLSNAVGRFSSHLFLNNGYRNALEALHRPDTDFLCDAFIAPLYAFQEADLQPIYNDLDEVFPSMVSTFYANCFEIARKEIENLLK